MSEPPTAAWEPLLERERALGTEATAVMTFRPVALDRPEGEVAPGPPSPGAVDLDVLEEVGRGGMGVVYRARQASLGREVALKVAREDAGPGTLGRFLHEARATGRLEHANIVPVHALVAGPDGMPRLVLRLVRGTSWGDLLASGRDGAPLPLREHLRILRSACHAVAHAHERGVLHRDLKPDNVMVGEHGEVFVMDWGVAAALSPDVGGVPLAADTRGPVGTPAYMAPELAGGEGHLQGPATDVYLLGACLHRVLTGRPPHTGARVLDVLMHAMNAEPATYGPEVPAPLVAIARRATARAPVDRFAGADALGQALDEFLEREQAIVLTAKADEGRQRLGERLQGWRSADDEEARRAAAGEVHRLHAEAEFAYQHALEVWPGSPGAQAGLRELRREVLRFALDAEDLSLAARLGEALGEPDAARSVDALRAELSRRARELEALRERTRLDAWEEVAGPLGATLLAAGLLGGAATALSAWVRHARPDLAAPAVRFAAWAVALVITAALALRVFRRGLPARSAVAVRVVGTWCAVGVACLVLQGVAAQLGLSAYRALPLVSLLLGVGAAALALQVRPWLLVTAVALFATAPVAAALPGWEREVVGGGVAFALTVIGGWVLARRRR